MSSSTAQVLHQCQWYESKASLEYKIWGIRGKAPGGGLDYPEPLPEGLTDVDTCKVHSGSSGAKELLNRVAGPHFGKKL